MSPIQGFVPSINKLTLLSSVASFSSRGPLYLAGHRRPLLFGRGAHAGCLATAALLSCGVSVLGGRGLTSVKMSSSCGSLQVKYLDLNRIAFLRFRQEQIIVSD